MTRERSWMWTNYWCAACYVAIAVLCIYRKEPAWLLVFSLANVVFFAVLGERNRREVPRERNSSAVDAYIERCTRALEQKNDELEEKNQAQAKMIAGYIDLISAANDIGVTFWWEGKEGRTARAELSKEARALAISLNLNEQVSVRFTEVGEALWIAFHEGKPPESEMPNPQGWRRCQLWHLFHIYGPEMYLGCQVPFVDNEIRLELPAVKERWPRACHLCGENMESEADRAEWHGLGNCVPVCMTCMGSGIAEEKAKGPQVNCSDCGIPMVAVGGLLNAHALPVFTDYECPKCHKKSRVEWHEETPPPNPEEVKTNG